MLSKSLYKKRETSSNLLKIIGDMQLLKRGLYCFVYAEERSVKVLTFRTSFVGRLFLLGYLFPT